MKQLLIITYTLAAVLVLTATSVVSAQNRPYRVTERQVTILLNRIETRTDNFQRQMSTALDRNRYRGQIPSTTVEQYVNDFESATDRLRERFNANTSVSTDVQEVLTRAAYIDQFMRTSTLTAAASNQWGVIRRDLDILASYYNVAWNWDRVATQPGRPIYQPPYRATDAQLRALLTRLESKTDVFNRQMNTALDRSRFNNTAREENIEEFITGFENATDRLKQRVDARETASQDAMDVLTQAAYINRFMTRNAFTRPAQNQWNSIRSDLNTLATYYSVSWNWNRTLPPYQPYRYGTGWMNASLTGTYRLNTAASDNVSRVVSQSVNRYFNAAQRARVQRNLERRLSSPEMLVIEQDGSNIAMASTLAPQATFAADGVSRTEMGPRGRSITTSADIRGNDLEIRYVGDRANDFYATFSPQADGDLRVTKRVHLENRNEMVTVNSVYTRTAQVARWADVNVSPIPGQYPDVVAGEFYIPNGTRLTTVLRTPMSTDTSQVNDRFTLEVISPVRYRGAFIEGRIVDLDDSGRLSGRANLTMDFDTIRLTNGQTYRFAGLINAVRDEDGDTVSVTNEGTLREGNQTTRTVTRGGIGAVLGAIIGAVVGGGEGAAIGAGVGAGAGVGSILLGGRDELELQAGSRIDVTASSPANYGIYRP